MKYLLNFVLECNSFKYDFRYIDEVKDLMVRHNMIELFESKIQPKKQVRWTPQEIFHALEN